jgi:hypothetical protein
MHGIQVRAVFGLKTRSVCVHLSKSTVTAFWNISIIALNGNIMTTALLSRIMLIELKQKNSDIKNVLGARSEVDFSSSVVFSLTGIMS